MKNKTLNEIIIEVVLESHLDMFFYQLLAVIVQEQQEKISDWEYNDKNRGIVSEEFLLIARVLLYDTFSVTIDNYDVSQNEREHVQNKYKGYYNYSEMLVYDIHYRGRIKYEVSKNFGVGENEFMSLCAANAIEQINQRLQNKEEDYFMHYYVSRKEDTKLVIYTSVFGMFNANTLFTAFRDNKFQILLNDYLVKYGLLIVKKDETSIEFGSDLVIGLNDAQLLRTLPGDFFKTFNVDFKISNGVFWRYIKKSKKDYVSFELGYNFKPVVSFLDDPYKTLLTQCQIYLEHIKI